MAAGFTEAEAGSDVQKSHTTARRVPGGVRITGEKNSVTGMPAADWVAILGREIGGDGNQLGFSQFLIPADAPGLSRAEMEDMGGRVRGRGGFSYTRASPSLICVGAADATLQQTVAHTSSRTALGKPLAANRGRDEAGRGS